MTGAELSFDALAHEYRRPDGAVIPSVTQILGAVGVAVNFEELRTLSTFTAAAIELKREIGTALHQDAHAYDDNDLDWTTVDPRVLPYLHAWVTFRENSGLVPTTRERRVYHPTLGYAGTLDGIFQLPTGHRVLVDIKTGDPDDSGCAYQTAAYVAAYEIENPDAVIHQRWGVRLTPDRAIPYRVSHYADWRDFAHFQAFVTTFHLQAVRRRKAA